MINAVQLKFNRGSCMQEKKQIRQTSMQHVLPGESQKAAPESSVQVTTSDSVSSRLLACDVALFPPFQIEVKEMCPFFSPSSSFSISRYEVSRRKTIINSREGGRKHRAEHGTLKQLDRRRHHKKWDEEQQPLQPIYETVEQFYREWQHNSFIHLYSTHITVPQPLPFFICSWMSITPSFGDSNWDPSHCWLLIRDMHKVLHTSVSLCFSRCQTLFQNKLKGRRPQ